MEVGVALFVFTIVLLVAGFVIYLIREYDKAHTYDSNDNTNEKTINEDESQKVDYSQSEEMGFPSFLDFCDECINIIDDLPISSETREELELCYARYRRDFHAIPFSTIIQSDIICFLFKCRLYTAVLNQQKNVSVLKYFENIFPKESIDCSMVRIASELLSIDDEIDEKITLSDYLPSMLFFSHFMDDVLNSEMFLSLIGEKKDIKGPSSWPLVVILYISNLSNSFFEYGSIPAKDFEYTNVRKCLSELFQLSSKFKKTSITKSNIPNKTLESKQIHKKNDNKINHTKSDLDLLLNELNSLIGLSKVKEEVNTLINLVKNRKQREAQGLKPVPLSLHLVFSGNPGTGKTTVARILAKIYKELGVLSKGQLIETDRSGLVAGYVGQTALKTQETIEQAKGGILFIDEAYSLSTSKDSNDFGKEAIDTLLKAMEDMRDDFIVIVAGYPDLMKQFLKSNPGLESRFNTFIDFEDYLPEDLLKIFKVMCHEKDYIVSEDLNNELLEYFNNLYSNRDESYANARTVRNFLENAIKKQANRLAPLGSNSSKKDLQELIYEDLF